MSTVQHGGARRYSTVSNHSLWPRCRALFHFPSICPRKASQGSIRHLSRPTAVSFPLLHASMPMIRTLRRGTRRIPLSKLCQKVYSVRISRLHNMSVYVQFLPATPALDADSQGLAFDNLVNCSHLRTGKGAHALSSKDSIFTSGTRSGRHENHVSLNITVLFDSRG